MIPIATCSPKNSNQVREYGAEATFDYREPDCATKIVSILPENKHFSDSSHVDNPRILLIDHFQKAYTKNNLRFALDCITTVESTAFCFASLGRAGGKYVSLDPFTQHAVTRATVKTDWVLGPSIFGDGSTWPAPYGRPPCQEIRAYGEKLWAVAQKLVNEGKLRHHPVRILEGGLEEVLAGMELVRSGKLSGEKCVVCLGN